MRILALAVLTAIKILSAVGPLVSDNGTMMLPADKKSAASAGLFASGFQC